MTKKVKRLGRFGSRYGVGIRKRTLKIEAQQFAKHSCPQCSAPKVKRLAAGIFKCRKCSYEFAGGAYLPETMSGSLVKKIVVQKTTLPNLKGQREKDKEKEIFKEEKKKEKPKEEKKHVEKKNEDGVKPVSKTAKKKKAKKEKKTKK